MPLARYIDIEDSEATLRAIRLTPPEMPIDLIVHTPGGLVPAAEQIAHALLRQRPDADDGRPGAQGAGPGARWSSRS
jgi:ClpP class serine protease